MIDIATKGFFSPPIIEVPEYVPICDPKVKSDETGTLDVFTYEFKPTVRGKYIDTESS